MELTLKQRNECYNRALARLLEKHSIGDFGLYVCVDLTDIAEDILGITCIKLKEVVNLFLEFAKFKPKDIQPADIWWPIDLFEPREKALLECIRLTETTDEQN